MMKSLHMMKGRRAGFLVIILLLMALSISAQDVKVTATAPKVVRAGEQFRIMFTVTGDFSDFKAPDLAPFRVLSGPNQSRSSNFEFRNGKTTTSKTTTYTYWLQGTETGSFSISPATVTLNRKQKIASNKVVIQVVAGKNTGKPSASQTGSGQQTASQQSPTSSISGDDVFVRTEVSKKKVYIGEQFVVSQKVYTRLNLAGFGDISFPGYNGFWSQDVDIPDRISLERVSLNNDIYGMGELKRTILFPQKSGKLTLDPARVEVITQVRSRQARRNTGDPFFDSFFNDSFFNSGVANVPVECESKPVTIEVLPLPESGRPADFSGAVGQFSVSSVVDKTTLKANEALTIKYKISGTGNLQLLDISDIQFPPDFEVYDPKVSRNIQVKNNAVTGTVTFEYVLIPRSGGVYGINPVHLSYFDPQKGQYVKLRTSNYEVTVEKGDEPSEAVMYSGLAKEEVRMIGEDIRYLKTGAIGFIPTDSSFPGTVNWYLIAAALVVVFIALFVVLSLYRRNRADIAGMKNRQATRIAKKRLQTASKLLHENKVERFYEEVSNALWGYLGDKLNIPPSELNTENAKSQFVNHQVGNHVADAFFSIVSHCDYARFAPGDLSSGMQNVYKEALSTITQLEKYFTK